MVNFSTGGQGESIHSHFGSRNGNGYGYGRGYGNYDGEGLGNGEYNNYGNTPNNIFNYTKGLGFASTNIQNYTAYKLSYFLIEYWKVKF